MDEAMAYMPSSPSPAPSAMMVLRTLSVAISFSLPDTTSFCYTHAMPRPKLPRPTCIVCRQPRSRQSRRFCSHRCQMKYMSGPRHWNYKGGHTNERGYRTVCDNGRTIAEHRLVMERHSGRRLERHEHVHHINGNPGDNRIENLQLFDTQEAHSRHHWTTNHDNLPQSRFTSRSCNDCGQLFVGATSSTRCSTCRLANRKLQKATASRRYYHANRTQCLNAHRLWALKNRDHVIRNGRARYQQNRTQYQQVARAYYRAHRKERRAYNRAYHKKNRERLQIYYRQRYQRRLATAS